MAISANVPKSGPSLVFDFAESKQLDSRMLFSRASSGSYIGADGLIKTADTNIPRFNHRPVVITNKIKKSEELNDNTVWGTSGPGSLLVTTNATPAPNGISSAEKLYEAVFTGVHDRYQEIASVSGPHTFSVYLKKSERNYVSLSLAQAGFINGGQVVVNINAGTVQSTTNLSSGTNTSGRVVAVGNGWYRCSITTTVSGTVTAYAAIVPMNDSLSMSYAGDGVSGVFAWGAQVESGSRASDYLTNPSIFVKSETKVESLGLLIEETSTNLIDYSEFITGSWAGGVPGSGYAALYTPNTTETLDPKGANTAAKVYQNGTGFQRITKGIATPSGASDPHTWSIFVKRGNSDTCVIEHTGAWTQGGRVTWNFATETLTTSSPLNFGNFGFDKYPNGWYRIYATFVPGTTSGNVWIWPGADYEGASIGAFTYVWGYQIESHSIGTAVTTLSEKISVGAPTSYIYCNGAATTRSADLCYATLGFRQNCNYDQSSIVAKVTFDGIPVRGHKNRTTYATVGAGFIWNTWWETGPLRFATIAYTILNGYDFQASSSRQIVRKETIIGKTSIKKNDLSIILNNEQTVSDTASQNSMPLHTQIELGSFGNFHHLNGSIAKLMYYPRRVNNLEFKGVL